MAYERTTGYRNYMNRRRLMPTFIGNRARSFSGRYYLITKQGWRVMSNVSRSKISA